MTLREAAIDLDTPAPVRSRQHAVTLGRVALAALLLLAWKLSAEMAGPLYVADPIKVVQRIVADTLSGSLLRDTYVTLRLSAIGFALGCGLGIALPFLLRRLPRLTAAVEPYIMASVGIPKASTTRPSSGWSACSCSTWCSSRCSPAFAA